MPGFTSEEIQTQIDRFLTTQVASARTKLGLRDTLSMRDQVYDLLSTTLLLRPDAFFYLVWLTSNKLEGFRALQASDIETIDTLGAYLGYRTKRISSTTEVTNAQAAMLQLNAGLNARRTGQGIQGSIGPAVDRFRRATERFIRTELEPNVVRSGTVTETPEEIRTTIAARLVDLLARHEIIHAMAVSITEGVARLDTVKLPETAVRAIVSRISEALDATQETMSGDDALSLSRETMLELLVMRTLLTKASSFRAPSQGLAPLPGDPATVSLTAGSVPGSLTGDISGPFNYDILATNQLRFQEGTPVTQVDVVLSWGSNALLASQELAFPFTPTGGSAIDVSVDGGAFATMAPVAVAYATPALLATHLSSLVAGITVIADGNFMLFLSDTFDDGSSLEFDPTSAGADLFMSDYALRAVYARGEEGGTEALVQGIGSFTNSIRAEEIYADLGAVSGSVDTATPTIIDNVLVAGADLVVTAASATVSSPSVNFETLGVRAGMGINITSIPLVASIISVEDNVLVMDTAAGASSTGTYEAGPDYRLPDGARIDLAAQMNFRNSGLYRVAVGGGAVAHLTLDRALIVSSSEPVDGVAFTSYLKVSAPGAGPLDGIAAFPADVGLTALGFTASATQTKGQATTATGADFLTRGVRPGDILTMAGLAVQAVVGVSAAGVTFTPGATFPASDPTYTITSARYTAWEALRASLQAWLDDDVLSTTKTLESQVARLLRGANYTGTTIETTVNAYEAGLATVQAALLAYAVPEDRGVLNIIRTLNEQGMDRARDLLVDLELSEFFTMAKDSVSYATHLIRVSADETRELVPVSKKWKSATPNAQHTIISNRPFREPDLSGR